MEKIKKIEGSAEEALKNISSDQKRINDIHEFLKGTKKDSEGLANKIQKRIVTKFMFQIDSKIKVKIVTGNIFKKKLRKMKIILNNNDCITNNMLSHEISYNNEILHKNKKTPISSLLEKFESSNFEISKKLIEVSSKTTEFLEKFYKC